MVSEQIWEGADPSIVDEWPDYDEENNTHFSYGPAISQRQPAYGRLFSYPRVHFRPQFQDLVNNDRDEDVATCLLKLGA